jgi:hypothetical protein
MVSAALQPAQRVPASAGGRHARQARYAQPAGDRTYRSDRNAARTSLAKSSGSSQAAK